MRPCRWFGVTLAIALVACDGRQATEPSAAKLVADLTASSDPVALAFNANALPYGTSMVRWSERWWQWEVSVPTAQNPGLDPTGADCAVAQTGGPVWYVAATFAPGALTRSCTIPSHTALLISLSGVLNDYPCPDPTFQPAPGQSLQDFLTQGARAVVDGVNGLTLSVDGRSVPNLFAYRYTTPLFSFTGDPSLQTSLDPCITGSAQPGVSDGYFIILKPLTAGTHTVVFTASDVQGVHTSVTYTLTVQPGEDGVAD